jgi:anti-sigma B factor antagonist
MTMTYLLVHDKGDVVVASFNAVKIVDQVSIEQIEKEFQAVTVQAASARKLLVDFSPVEFISSMMIGLIVRLHSRCKREGIRLKLCGVSASILEAFKVTGLRKVLEIYPDELQALEAFVPPGPESDW